MIRALYRCLLWLHPPLFRREFGGEMLWIYDEAGPTGGVLPLFCDAFVSLARQWFLRTGYWKYAVVLPAALFQVSIGGVLLFLTARPPHPTASAIVNPDMAALMRLAALTAIGLLAAVMLLVCWWRRLARPKGV